jgi:hypothetical protein
MMQESRDRTEKTGMPLGGLAGWLLKRLSGVRRSTARLAVVERISLAPRQSLALVEAEGRRFLVATSAEGTPAFYALDHGTRRPGGNRAASLPARVARISW